MNWKQGVKAEIHYKVCDCCGHKKEKLKLSERKYVCTNCSIVLDRDFNASKNLEKLAVSSTVVAYGDESSNPNGLQLICEVGIKHQMLKFV